MIQKPIIQNNKIYLNNAWVGGGICFSHYCSLTILDNTISNNSATYWGGGISFGGSFCGDNSLSKIINNTISNNSAGTYAGGISCYGMSLKLINNTIVGNSATIISQGDGIDIFTSSSETITIINTICWGNKARVYTTDTLTGVNITYSNIQDGWAGEGNINTDPLFVDAANNDYHLSDNSPCIDAGTMTADVPTTDIAGNPRPNPSGSKPDMGAYENLLGTSNQPPVANFTYYPESPESGDWITLDASNSVDSDGKVELYEWDLNNDGIYEDRTINPQTKSYRYLASIYPITLGITDNQGATKNITVNVPVKKKSFFGSLWEKLAGLIPWTKKDENLVEKVKSKLNISSQPLFSYCQRDYTDNDLKIVLDKKIDAENLPITYGVYILTAFEELEMVKYVWTQEYKNTASKFFNTILDINADADWSSVATTVTKELFTNLLHEPYSSGASSIFMVYDITLIGISIGALEKLFFYNSLWYYLQQRNLGDNHDGAWGSTPRRMSATNEELKIIEDYFKNLWDLYGNALSNDTLNEFREGFKIKVSELLCSLLEKNKLELSKWQEVNGNSPIEIRVYDSKGNITGIVNGEVKEGIPHSLYDYETETALILDSSDSYIYEVIGTDQGKYGLKVKSVEGGEATIFTATNIPTTLGQNHRYTIDWNTLVQGGQGVTMQIDSDGDGTFEETITTGSTFTMPSDVSALVAVANSNILFDRRSGQYSMDMTIKNTSQEILSSPIKLIIQNIKPSISVINADGIDNGNPYFDYSGSVGTDNNLSPGEISSVKRVIFSNPQRLRFSFDAKVMAVRSSGNPAAPSAINNSVIPFTITIPGQFALLQSYPNPFNPEVWIPYELAEPADVVISIYDTSGRLVRTLDLGHKEIDVYATRDKSAYWDGRNELGEQVASGIYFYQIKAGDFVATRKFVMLK